jgi:hypothetical protein
LDILSSREYSICIDARASASKFTTKHVVSLILPSLNLYQIWVEGIWLISSVLKCCQTDAQNVKHHWTRAFNALMDAVTGDTFMASGYGSDE